MTQLVRLVSLSQIAFVILSCSSKSPNSKSNFAYQEDTARLIKGDTIYPFRKFDIETGLWNVKIHISLDDHLDISEKVGDENHLSTSNMNVLRKVQNWRFKYLDADIATVESYIDFFRDHKKIASFGIVLDKKQVGLQSSQFGWAEAIDPDSLFETIKLFHH
jgi:hypothetical protein